MFTIWTVPVFAAAAPSASASFVFSRTMVTTARIARMRQNGTRIVHATRLPTSATVSAGDEAGQRSYDGPMSETAIAPGKVVPVSDESTEQDRPWLVIVHNDPINLMSYVTWVFKTLFGYPQPKAHKLMM